MTDAEIKKNAAAFRAAVESKIPENISLIKAHSAGHLDDSYARLTTLQAWRSFVFDEHLSTASLGFYSEAQNDGLTSSALMSVGLWRPAMKSLRSLLENMLHGMYYNDHVVEYRLWEQGKFRPTFKSLFDYFQDHPDIYNLPNGINSSTELHSHYKYLSNIVHASAKEFRMTDDVNKLKLWDTSKGSIGKWNTIHKNVIKGVNLLFLNLFRSHLQGASAKGLRESIALAIPANKDNQIKNYLGVKIPR